MLTIEFDLCVFAYRKLFKKNQFKSNGNFRKRETVENLKKKMISVSKVSVDLKKK